MSDVLIGKPTSHKPIRFTGIDKVTRLVDLKPGQSAILSQHWVEPVQDVYFVRHDVVTIESIEPHRGKTVNGLRVENPRYDEDYVDLVTVKGIHDKTSKQFLYGSYYSNHHPASVAKRYVNLMMLDNTGEPLEYVTYRSGNGMFKNLSLTMRTMSLRSFDQFFDDEGLESPWGKTLKDMTDIFVSKFLHHLNGEQKKTKRIPKPSDN